MPCIKSVLRKKLKNKARNRAELEKGFQSDYSSIESYQAMMATEELYEVSPDQITATVAIHALPVFIVITVNALCCSELGS